MNTLTNISALLTADEAARLTLGLNVIVRPGRKMHTETQTIYERPRDWVALTGPCPTCGGSSTTCGCDAKWSTNPNHNRHCLLKRKCDCRDGRRIVPLYTECASPYCDGKGGDKDQPGWRCPNFCNKARVLAGRGSIKVVPVVDGGDKWDGQSIVYDVSHRWLYMPDGGIPYEFITMPVPGRDFGIVIDCVEVA